LEEALDLSFDRLLMMMTRGTAPWKDDRSSQGLFLRKMKQAQKRFRYIFMFAGTLMMETPPWGGKIQYLT